jgi:hypothetical protein
VLDAAFIVFLYKAAAAPVPASLSPLSSELPRCLPDLLPGVPGTVLDTFTPPPPTAPPPPAAANAAANTGPCAPPPIAEEEDRWATVLLA